MRSKASPQTLRRFAAICSGRVVFGICGCVHPVATAGRDADASIAAFCASLQDLNAALVQARTDIRAGGNVQQNDPWTMRLLGLGLMVMGLSYPVGKLLWITITKVRDRTDMLPFSQRRLEKCVEVVDA